MFKWWVKVEGLNHAELRHLTEKIGEQPEKQNELEKTAEFSIPTWMVSCKLIQIHVLMLYGFTGSQWFRLFGYKVIL